MRRSFFIGILFFWGTLGYVRADDTKTKAVGGTRGATSAREKENAKGSSPAVKPAEKKAPVSVQPAKKERVIDFTKEEEIRGVLTKPEAELIGARRKVHSKSLLPIRLHFILEMMKTVQEL